MEKIIKILEAGWKWYPEYDEDRKSFCYDIRSPA